MLSNSLLKKTSLLILFIIFSLLISEYYTFAADTQLHIEITAVCGDGEREGNEECDGDDLGGQTCQGLGYESGNLSCYPAGGPDECTFNTSNCTTTAPPSGGGGGVARVATKVIFKGKAYPNSSITILKDGKITTTVKADSKADFRAEITNITAGIYTFGLWAKDKDGIKSITYTLTFRVFSNTTTTVSGIYLPPTIDLDKTALQKGETLNIFGQAVPEVEVDVHIHSSEIIEQVQTDEIGAWLLAFDTQPLEEGSHITKARFNLNEEERSGFSGLLTFYIGEEGLPEEFCPRADLNKDGRTNLVDFSILLYWWGRANACVDQNRNGIVDLPDFSIMMYYWSG
ncbi:hypothetical protein KJA13_02475 [Patescibacteria group bacterium]|nr:hypothetical protein [Patescibacteria group bacterium]